MSMLFKNIFLRTCWCLGLFHISRYLMKDKLQILCYHGFETYDESHFRPKLFVKSTTFNKRLELISKHNFPVLNLEEALNKLRNGKLPSNAIVITIDDGFYNVLNIAADILNAHKFPATLYLTTYYVQNNTPIFRLAVQYMFWKTKKLAVSFDCCIWSNNKNINVPIDNEKEYERIMWECINFGENRSSEPEKIAICQQLSTLLGVDYQLLCDSRILSLLTVDEARLLNNKGINIQLHTHRHWLSVNDESQAKKEIIDNRKVLEEIVDYPTKHFCYPSGIWNEDQWPWLEQMDIESATTCLPGLNNSGGSAMGLKRFLDGENISEIVFLAELFGFAELTRTLRRKLKIL